MLHWSLGKCILCKVTNIMIVITIAVSSKKGWNSSCMNKQSRTTINCPFLKKKKKKQPHSGTNQCILQIMVYKKYKKIWLSCGLKACTYSTKSALGQLPAFRLFCVCVCYWWLLILQQSLLVFLGFKATRFIYGSVKRYFPLYVTICKALVNTQHISLI